MSEIQVEQQESVVDAAPVVDETYESETAVDEAVAAGIAEIVHTHESILVGLLEKLEGLVHMGKSEIEAIVAEARVLVSKI